MFELESQTTGRTRLEKEMLSRAGRFGVSNDGDVNNEIGFPGNVKALNLDVATLTPSCNSNVPSLGRESR